jgi:copper chaperone
LRRLWLRLQHRNQYRGRPDDRLDNRNCHPKESTMNNQSYAVIGMTCGHCASAVTSELTALDGVTDVQVDLVVGGTSTVTVASAQPLEDTQVAGALEEAGDYQLA